MRKTNTASGQPRNIRIQKRYRWLNVHETEEHLWAASNYLHKKYREYRLLPFRPIYTNYFNQFLHFTPLKCPLDLLEPLVSFEFENFEKKIMIKHLKPHLTASKNSIFENFYSRIPVFLWISKISGSHTFNSRFRRPRASFRRINHVKR